MHQTQKSTWISKEASEAQRRWHVIDLDGVVLGRAATTIASVLRGKNKPTYTPNVDSGDFVVVINAAKVKLTGRKLDDKIYRRHTLFPGGLKETPAKNLLMDHPDRLIRAAVWGMIPKGRLGRRIIKKLKIFPGGEHTHRAQNPAELSL